MNKTDCFDLESLSLYSVGGGSEKWRRDMAAHVAKCAKCKRELAALEAVPDMLARSPKPETPDQWHAISARLEPRAQGWFTWPVLTRPKALGAAIGLILVMAFAGLYTINAPSPKPTPATQQAAVSQTSDDELAQSHMALTWNEPFADSVSLAVMSENRSRIQ